ncbi:MAG TPA: FAD:protein FMN transferase [Candidatus Dormibacteraeota bacterium]|nr:FAD:protein FMN transferase [Candidatus Dormibacteraeota bacterium]
MTSGERWLPIPAPDQMASAKRAAFGTTAQVVAHPHGALPDVLPLVDAEILALDLAASRFRRDSALDQLNRSPAAEVIVGPLLAQLLELALFWADRSSGLLDPCVGAAVIANGYEGDFSGMAKDGPGLVRQVPFGSSWKSVEISGQTVHRPPGLVLDVGATAKAWGADRMASLGAQTGASVLVSLGGDLATSGPEPTGGWVVRVADDHEASSRSPGQTVRLRARALATSSVTRRRWRRGGVELHHIIDPRTGAPAQGPWRTVSVAAALCSEANAAATSAIVAGDGAVDCLAGFGLPARLVSRDGGVLHFGGWPSDGDDLSQITHWMRAPVAGAVS